MRKILSVCCRYAVCTRHAAGYALGAGWHPANRNRGVHAMRAIVLLMLVITLAAGAVSLTAGSRAIRSAQLSQHAALSAI